MYMVKGKLNPQSSKHWGGEKVENDNSQYKEFTLDTQNSHLLFLAACSLKLAFGCLGCSLEARG
jgi:hypothetical protein